MAGDLTRAPGKNRNRVEISTDHHSVTHANNAAVSLAAVIEMPKPAIEEIAQLELTEYSVYVKEARMSRMNLRAKRQEIIAKLSAGAEVADGPLEAALLTVKRGTKSIVRLMVRV
jgi:hypothetical protein